MHAQIRTVPELPITDLLARAFGVRPVVYADARGRSAEIRLESGASLIIEASNGSLEVSTKFPPYTLDTLDELRERLRDTDVLVRWAEFVTEYATARLTRGDATAAMHIVESMSIDDSDEEFLRQIGDLAVVHEVNLEGTSAVEALINLALTLRELHAIASAAEHAPSPIIEIDLPMCASPMRSAEVML